MTRRVLNRICRLLVLVALPCATAPLPARNTRSEAKLEVRKVEQYQGERGAFRVRVTVTNEGAHSIFLARSDRHFPEKLHALTVQQWQASTKTWKNAIPALDARPAGLIELPPGESIEDSIVVVDVPAHRPYGNGVFIEGKHRAALWIYETKKDWERGRLVLVVSEPFEIHRPAGTKDVR